jgi:DNA-binding NtrC family response regulator
VKYFIQHFVSKLNKIITGISPDCLAALRNYSWPGNIRQLENVLERMVLMTEGTTLTVSDLPEEVVSTSGGDAAVAGATASFKEIVRRQTQAVERELIEKALEETEGNVTRAAERLGLSRKGLQIKIKELGLR